MKNGSKMLKKFIFLAAFLVLFLLPVTVFAQETDTKDESEAEENVYYYDHVVNAGWDTGYSESKEISSDDVHYGWSLGKFIVTGFSRVEDEDSDNPVFYVPAGQTLKISFLLEQDIENLNPSEDGKKRLYIANDKDGYDKEFDIAEGSMGRGALLMEDVEDPDEIWDYLDNFLANQKKGEEIEFFDVIEGEYLIALDYEVADALVEVGKFSLFPKSGDYRIRFHFTAYQEESDEEFSDEYWEEQYGIADEDDYALGDDSEEDSSFSILSITNTLALIVLGVLIFRMLSKKKNK